MKNLSKKLEEKNKTLITEREEAITDLWKSINVEKFKHDLINNFNTLIDNICYKHNSLKCEIELENKQQDRKEMFIKYSNPVLCDEYFCQILKDELFINSIGNFEIGIRKEIINDSLRLFVKLTLLEFKTNG